MKKTLDIVWDDLAKRFNDLQEELKEIDPENRFLKYKSMNEVILSPEYVKRREAAQSRVSVYLLDIEREIEKLRN